MRWSDATARPTDRQLREFAAALSLALAALAAWQVLSPGQLAWSAGYAAGALAAGLTGAIRPRWLAPLFRAWMILAFPLAWVVSTLLLAILFFGLVTPLALIFRLAGRDALDRRPQPGKDTYWQEKPAAEDPSRYLRQY